MSTFEKRAREDKRNQKAREKAQRRVEKRNAPPSSGSEFTSVAEIVGNVRSIAEVMQRIRPLMDEGALSTGAGRRQLLTEMRRLNEVIGL